MITVKISNGEVFLKEFCTRKLRKEINRKLFEDVRSNQEGKISGISIIKIDEAQDLAVLGMIEKIVIDGKEIQPTLDFLDNLSDTDFRKIHTKVEELTNPEKNA